MEYLQFFPKEKGEQFIVRKALRNGWKRVCSVILAAAMVITMLPVNTQAATSSSDNGDGTFSNPVIYADVPDIDIIRVGDAYYMVSTTMHLSPGCPIMKSTDLVNWEIVNYVYDILGDTDAMNLRNGESMYGNGQWAASLKYHDGTYYVAFNSNTTGTAYLYTTDDIERGAWSKTTLNGGFHDMSLFFDDDGKAYVLYGGGQIKCAELSADLKTVNKDTEKVLFDIKTEDWGDENIGTGLAGEGTHIMKKGEYYYVFNVCWPSGGGRTEICHRSKTFPSTEWENQIILKANFQNNGVSGGVAQGAVIDTADGKWYGFMFQDHGAIGRVPVLTDCTWKNDWPMLGKDGDGVTIETTMPLPVVGSDGKSLVKSDEFYNDAEHRVFDAEQTATATANTYNAAAQDSGMETVELVENGNFEGGKGTTGWVGFESGEIEVVSADDGVNNSNVLRVKNRKNSSSSAMYDLTGKIDKAITYTIKGKMKYVAGDNGPAKKEFTVRFQNRPTKQTPEYWNHRHAAGTIELNKNEWKEFEISYKPADNVVGGKVYPFGTGENYFFIENSQYVGDTTTSDNKDQHGMDYYLDDISITYERPVGGEIDDSLLQLFTNGNAELGTTEGWTSTPGEQACTLAAVDTEKANGTYSIYVSDRKSPGAGACQDISGKLVEGKTYTISGKLKYTEGTVDEKKFIVTIQNGKDYHYRTNVVSFTAKKGQWVEFQGTYTAADKSEEFPFDPQKNFIFVENQYDSTENMNYYLDDFSMTTPSDNMIRNGSFENGTMYWSGFEKATIAVTKEEHQEGSQSVAVTGRTACAQGPSQDLSGKLTPGNTYTMEAWVKYNTGVEQKQFNLTIQNGPDYSYRTVLGSAKAKKGEWTKISAVWTMPDDASTTQNYLFFETPYSAAPTAENDLMDFYVDNVSMIEKVNDPKEPAESGEHDYNGSNLDLVWQWNHNPNNNNWSLTERNGWLRLKTGNKSTSLLNARNTLTQRTFGPVCSGTVKMDISNMKTGDVAGLGSLSFKYGYIAVKKEADKAKLVMVDASGNNTETKEDKPVEKASADCNGNIVYLKEDFNFAGNADGSDKDTVTFYYSFDGKTWEKLGDSMKMSYELVHFMGSKFAIFNYATKTPGGYVDYDYFRVSDRITGAEQPGQTLNAAMTAAPEEISGVMGSECEVKLNLDELESGNYTSLKASLSVPDILTVEDVVFNAEAIKGETAYTFKNGRLNLTVKGSDVSFAAADKLFATIKLKTKGYADKDETVSITADYIRADGGAAEYNTDNCSASIKLKYLDTKALAKKLGYGNPITTHEFGADPYAIVYDGRVYVYMTADDYEFSDKGNPYSNNFGYITTLRVVSSADLVNWTDHGEIDVAGRNGGKGPAEWASHAWAPAVAYKKIDGKDKFFLYFANDASGIGVLEADSPLGPWKDPIGKALITGSTPGCQGVVWCFDPAVLVDDDGSAYIYFGGGVPEGQQDNPKTARVAKLGADMVSIDGDAVEIDAPCMFEDGGIFKYNGKYYYSYCSNFISPHKDGYPGFGSICYMVSDNPMGPFEYKGEIFSNPQVWFNVGGNNHHATFVYEGKSYFIYHAQTVSKALGVQKGYRSTHIDNIQINSDDTIRDIKGTYKGIPQLRGMNPYERIDAETIAWNSGVKAVECKEPGSLFNDYNMALTDLQNGDWTSISQLEFGEKGAAEFEAYAASKEGGEIQIRVGSPQGTLIGTMDVPATGSDDTYQKVSCKVENIKGTQDVFLVFSGKDGVTLGTYRETVDSLQAGITAAEKTFTPRKQLQSAINKAGKLKSGLSSGPAGELDALIKNGQGVLNNQEAAEAEINTALTELSTKMDELDNEQPTDNLTKERLKYKITEAEALLGELAEAEKVKLQTLITGAKELLVSDNLMNVDYYQFTEKTGGIVDPEPEKPTEEQIAKLEGKITTAKGLLAQLSGTAKTKLETAIAAAQRVLDSADVTAADVTAQISKMDAAIEAAKEAIDDASKPVSDQLTKKIEEAKALLNQLTGTAKDDLQAAIEEAEAELKKPGATDEQLQQALNKLDTAVGNAEQIIEANKPTEQQIADMQSKIIKAKELLDALTGTDRTNLQNAITAAENILEKEDLTKAELQEAFDTLSAAVTTAEEIIESKKPLKEQLSNKVAEAENLLEKLSGAEKEKLQAAITEAKKVLDKEGATDEEIQPVLDSLKGAVKAAEEYLEAEKQLNDKIAEAEEMLEKLSGAEKEKLQAAIDAVKELLKTEGVTKEQLEEALRNLTNAVEESKPVEEQLNNKIAEAEKLLEKLTGADREELQAAIDAAKEILKTEGATKEQLEQVLANLKAAVNKAIEITKPVEERLADKIAAAKKLLETLSADKKAGLEAVIREAETILSKPDATEAEIKAVLDRLIAAIEEAKKPETPPTPPVQEEKPGLNQTFTEANGLTYKVTAYSTAAKTVTVTKASKQLASVTIPDTVVYRKEIFKVTAIGDSAFANQKKLKSAVIGKNIVTIGKKAFLNDKKLVKITFKGTAVKTIGKDAFKNIGKKAVFTMNKNFTAKNLKYKITKCTMSVKEVTVTGSSKKLTSVNVPATVKFNGMVFKVTAINKKAFRKQTKLKSVVIGKNVKNIGSEAFSGAKKLAKVKFSGTAVKTIGKNAFKSIKKNAVFSVKKSKRTYYKKLLKKAKTSNFKMK